MIDNTGFPAPSFKNDTISSAYSTPKQPKISANYHILLVEDNLINQKVLSKQLRSTGCVVHVAKPWRRSPRFLIQNHALA